MSMCVHYRHTRTSGSREEDEPENASQTLGALYRSQESSRYACFGDRNVHVRFSHTSWSPFKH